METDQFEPAMPPAVRKLVANARKRKGPAATWFAERKRSQTSATYVMLRGAEMPPEAIGWLAGIAMFEDELGSITDVVKRERIGAPVPTMLDAFVAGVRAGVPLARNQWKRIEVLAGMLASVPAKLRDVVPHALTSDSAVDRGVGLRLARRGDAREVIERARDAATGKPRKRLDEALATLGGGTAAAGEPLRATSKAELEVLWLARAASRKPADLDVLLGTPWPGAWKAALARIKALSKFRSDARIAAILPRISAQHTSYGSRPLRAEIAVLARKLERFAPPPSAKPSAAGVDALWREVREHPRDLAARAVLADALQAAGDPRGEYLALALALAAGRADAATKKRASQLLAAHIDTWSAGIPGALRGSRRFERGFLTAVQCKTTSAALLASVDEPTWWSVEELHLASDRSHGSAREAVGKLLDTAPSLEAIIAHHWSWSEALFELRGAYRRIRVIGTRGVPDAMNLDAYPELEMLGVSGRVDVHLESATEIPILLVFDHRPIGSSLDNFAKQPAVAELRVAVGYQPEMDHRGWLVRVHRGDKRATLSWGVGEYTPGSLTAHVDALVASGRREIEVAPPAIGTDAVKAEAKRLKRATISWLAEPLATWRLPPK